MRTPRSLKARIRCFHELGLGYRGSLQLTAARDTHRAEVVSTFLMFCYLAGSRYHRNARPPR
jgi:hypothetical protein